MVNIKKPRIAVAIRGFEYFKLLTLI
ncbi:MAG: hypothetical protein ACI89M_002193, partial [Chitinophagales bacterium]